MSFDVSDDDDRHDEQHEAGDQAEDSDEHDEDGRPARPALGLEPGDDGVEAEREEQRGADVGEDRRQLHHREDDEQADAHAESSDQAEPERVLDLH